MCQVVPTFMMYFDMEEDRNALKHKHFKAPPLAVPNNSLWVNYSRVLKNGDAVVYRNCPMAIKGERLMIWGKTVFAVKNKLNDGGAFKIMRVFKEFPPLFKTTKTVVDLKLIDFETKKYVEESQEVVSSSTLVRVFDLPVNI